MLTDGRRDGRTDRRTEWGIAIALSQIGWLGAKNNDDDIDLQNGRAYLTAVATDILADSLPVALRTH